MNGWYVWTKRDTGRMGWEREESESSPFDTALDDQLKSLIAPDRFAQLEHLEGDRLKSTEGIPIVSAVWHPDAGRWVLVLRGLGGAFGAAGTTQLCAGPVGFAFAGVWTAFWDAVGAEGRVVPSRLGVPVDRWSTALDAKALESVRQALRLLAQEPVIAQVSLPPSQTPALYGAVARLLPESAARRICWSTCHVAGVIVKDQRIITGCWPDELVAAWPKARNRLTVGDRILTETGLPAPAADEETNLTWLLDQAARGHYPLTESTESTVGGVLRQVDEFRGFEVDDLVRIAARGQVLTNQQTRKIATSPDLVREFIRQAPTSADAMLSLADPHTDLFGQLALGLALDLGTEMGKRVRRRLASEAVSDQRVYTRRVRPFLRGKENVFLAQEVLLANGADHATLLAARPWLAELKVTPADAPELFVFDPLEVVEVASKDIDRAVLLLRDGPEARKHLKEVIATLGLASPSAANLLVAATAAWPADPHTVQAALPPAVDSEYGTLQLIKAVDRAVRSSRPDQDHRLALAAGLFQWASASGQVLQQPLVAALLCLATGSPSTYFEVPRRPPAQGRKRLIQGRKRRFGRAPRGQANPGKPAPLGHAAKRPHWWRRTIPAPVWAVVCVLVVALILIVAGTLEVLLCLRIL